MIWLWIILACASSIMLLKTRNVRFHNYIWAFVPIDSYGITVSGSTIKPYMIFGLILVIAAIGDRRRKSSQGVPATLVIAFMFLVAGTFITDLLNGPIVASVLQHILVAVIAIIGFCYFAGVDLSMELREILECISLVALCYGAVFVICWALYLAGIQNLDIYATSHDENGLILRHTDYSNGTYLISDRLRGFYYDQNSLVTMFVLPLSYSCVCLLSDSRRYGISRRLSFLIVLVCVLCLILTNSRTAIAIVLLAAVIVAIYMTSRRGYIGQLVLGVLATGIAMIVFVGTGAGGAILTSLNDFFYQRSSFTDAYGRGTIWADHIRAIIDGPLFTGYGQNQAKYVSVIGKECHNTWLEWICGAGLIVGGFACLLFIGALVKFVFSVRKTRSICSESNLLNYFALGLGYMLLLASLTTIDFIMNAYLIFLCMALYSVAFNLDSVSCAIVDTHAKAAWNNPVRNGRSALRC